MKYAMHTLGTKDANTGKVVSVITFRKDGLKANPEQKLVLEDLAMRVPADEATLRHWHRAKTSNVGGVKWTGPNAALAAAALRDVETARGEARKKLESATSQAEIDAIAKEFRQLLATFEPGKGLAVPQVVVNEAEMARILATEGMAGLMAYIARSGAVVAKSEVPVESPAERLARLTDRKLAFTAGEVTEDDLTAEELEFIIGDDDEGTDEVTE